MTLTAASAVLHSALAGLRQTALLSMLLFRGCTKTDCPRCSLCSCFPWLDNRAEGACSSALRVSHRSAFTKPLSTMVGPCRLGPLMEIGSAEKASYNTVILYKWGSCVEKQLLHSSLLFLFSLLHQHISFCRAPPWGDSSQNSIYAIDV